MSSPQLPTLWHHGLSQMQVEQLKLILAVFAVKYSRALLKLCFSSIYLSRVISLTWHPIQWSGQVYCHDLAAQTRKVPEYPQLMYLNAL